MSNETLKSRGITGAASLVQGECLYDLFAITEKQKSISAEKLTKHLEKIHEELKKQGVLMRDLTR